MNDGDWRVFVLTKQDAKRVGCDELVRVHLMQNAFGVSFGFVEQRIHKKKGLAPDLVSFYLHCGEAGIGTAIDKDFQPIPSLRHGIEIIEWLWHEHKGKEKP